VVLFHCINIARGLPGVPNMIVSALGGNVVENHMLLYYYIVWALAMP
jgi:hypothetical protein